MAPQPNLSAHSSYEPDTRRPRRRPPHLVDAGDVPSSAQLAALALLVERGVAQCNASTLVGVQTTTGGDGDLHLRPLNDHPGTSLRGFIAPKAWHTLGFAGTGRMRQLPTPPVPNSPDDDERSAPYRRVVVVYLCGRHGRGWSRVTCDGEVVVDQALSSDPGEHLGLVADSIRRSLALPTAAAEGTPAAVWASVWVEHVLSLALALPAPESLTWSDVVSLAPRWSDVRVGITSEGSNSPSVTFRGGWEQLEWAVGAGHLTSLGFQGDDIDWFDRGSLVRAVLADLPGFEPVLADLDELLSPEVARRLRACTEEVLAQPG